MRFRLISYIFFLWPLVTAAQGSALSVEDAIASAQKHRSQIVAARLMVSAAKLGAIAASKPPSTGFSLGISSPSSVGGSDDDLVLSQPLDIFGRSRRSAALGDALVQVAEAGLRSSLAELQLEVMQAYADVAAARALFESATKSEQIARQLHEAIRGLVELGKLPGVQLQRVEIELDRASLTRQREESELLIAKTRLAAVIGVEADNIDVTDFWTVPDRIQSPEAALSRIPEILILEAELRVAAAESRVALQQFLPELEVQARRTAWQDVDQVVGLRIQLSYGIFDFGRARAERKSAAARIESAKRLVSDRRKIAASEIVATQAALSSAIEQSQRFAAIAGATHDLVEKSRAGFAERAVTLVELLEATRALREVEEGLIESKLKLANAHATYLHSIGWQIEVKK